MSLKNRMEDFSFDVVSDATTKKKAAQSFDKESIGVHISEAKSALAEKQYGAYWTAVNKAAALMGAADSEEADDEITDKINRQLGGPGSED